MKRESRLLIVFVLALFTITNMPMRSEAVALQDDGVIFDPVTINAYLDANGTSTIHFNAFAQNAGISSIATIDIRIDSVHVTLVSARTNDTSAQASVENLERYSIVTIDLSSSLSSGDGLWIDLHLSMTDLQTESGISSNLGVAFSDFIFYIRPLSTYSNFTLTVFIPPTSTLSQESVTPIFPQSAANYTDGLSMAFIWQVDILQSGQEKVFIVRYQIPLEASSPSTISSLQLVLIALAFLGVGLVIGYAGPKIIVRLREISRVRIVGITSEEEEVMDAIRTKGGSCPQKDLYRDLDMSQAKVSLLLTALEERGLVRRFKDGRENTVHIIEE